ncbi:MAG TPA: GlsB/YeaQ/YmgE family stress response membrane protein [Candidatus Acidoferrum sp.]|nr:GlsB/YeaQ/YmgE family stress response membrane protein [Candidatus Acidoferrum sp.]
MTHIGMWGVYVDVGVVGWLIIGLLAGWLSGEITRGKGFGCLGNTLLGLIGAVLGGWLFSLLHISAYGFVGGLAAATVGAVVLVSIARAIAGS